MFFDIIPLELLLGEKKELLVGILIPVAFVLIAGSFVFGAGMGIALFLGAKLEESFVLLVVVTPVVKGIF
jgi:hypothetical protein